MKGLGVPKWRLVAALAMASLVALGALSGTYALEHGSPGGIVQLLQHQETEQGDQNGGDHGSQVSQVARDNHGQRVSEVARSNGDENELENGTETEGENHGQRVSQVARDNHGARVSAVARGQGDDGEGEQEQD